MIRHALKKRGILKGGMGRVESDTAGKGYARCGETALCMLKRAGSGAGTAPDAMRGCGEPGETVW